MVKRPVSMDRLAKKPRSTRKTRLHIFDFDKTLFHSPGPPPDLSKLERREFWHDPKSLGGELVPSKPNPNWYIQHIVEKFQNAKKDPQAKVVVMTGRSEPLRDKIKKLLNKMNLEPDELILKPKKDEATAKYKIREMKRLLQETPTIKKVHFYEDRESHLRQFQEEAEKEGYDFVPHYVSEIDSGRMWDLFMDTFYEGGARQVKNTNRDTKDRYPTVRADYLMRNDNTFASHVKRQFQKWVSMGKPRRKEASVEFLSLVLDLSRKAAHTRVVRRFLRTVGQ